MIRLSLRHLGQTPSEGVWLISEKEEERINRETKWNSLDFVWIPSLDQHYSLLKFPQHLQWSYWDGSHKPNYSDWWIMNYDNVTKLMSLHEAFQWLFCPHDISQTRYHPNSNEPGPVALMNENTQSARRWRRDLPFTVWIPSMVCSLFPLWEIKCHNRLYRRSISETGFDWFHLNDGTNTCMWQICKRITFRSQIFLCVPSIRSVVSFTIEFRNNVSISTFKCLLPKVFSISKRRISASL